MSEPHTTSQATPSPAGREANGTFAAGNQYGRGNPFARKVAAFRAALMEAVTEQHIKDIACKLRDDAKAGDKAATKLLFQYVIGKPQPAVDPDTLDAQEMRTFAANSLPPEAIEQMQQTLPLGWLAPLWSIYVDCRERQCAQHLGALFAAHDAREDRRAQRARQKAERKQRRDEALRAQPAASTDDDNGATAVAEEEAGPSPNPAMWVENSSAQDGVSPASPVGDFLREQREEIVTAHGVDLDGWATSPSRQRGT